MGHIRKQVDIWSRLIRVGSSWSEVMIAGQLGHLVGCSRSAMVSFYQRWSKQRTVVSHWQGHGSQGSLMYVGSKVWPVFSESTDELQELKLLKKCKKVAWSDESCFLFYHVDGWLCEKEGKPVQAGKTWALPSMWMLLRTTYPSIVADCVYSWKQHWLF